MNSDVVVKVFLIATGKEPPTKGGAIEFNYVLDNSLSDNWVAANIKGDLHVGNADQKNTTLTWVLQTKTLSWDGQTYNVTLAPTKNQPLGAAEMIYISTATGSSPSPTPSPSAPWPSTDMRFHDFKVAKNANFPNWDALQVTFDRDLGTDDVFKYGLAVNVSDSQNNFVATVRDDPLIKDRGVPSATNYWELIALSCAAMAAGSLITYLLMKKMRRHSQPNSN